MRPVALALAILKNRIGAVPRPGWCTYLVTYRCNARCKMCDSWRMKPGDELSPAQVADVFRKIGRLDVVRLTGGEPFLREDMHEIAEAVLHESAPRVLHITTNGSFPERVEAFARASSRSRRLRFMVSFDGLADEHDANRGADVPYTKAIETVKRLAALRSSLGLEVSANHTVISPQSKDDGEGLRREMDSLGVDVHSVLAYADSAMYGAKLRGKRADHLIVPKGYPLHPKLAGTDVLGFVEDELRRAGQLRSPLLRHGKRYYLRGLRARLRGESNARPHPPCVALRSHVRLLPDGRVPICQFNTETVGSLVTHTLEEIWFGAEIRDHRKWVDGCPGCWAECEVMPSAIYTGDLLFSRSTNSAN